MSQWPGAVPETPLPFSFQNAFSQGWQTLKERYPFLLGVFWIFIAIALASSIVVGIVDGILGFPVAQLLTVVFLDGPLLAGFYYAAVTAARGEKRGIDIVFIGFQRYWRCVGVYVLFSIIAGIVVGALALANGVVAASGGYVVLAILVIVSIAILVVIQVRLGFALPLAVDEHAGIGGVVDALRTSWAMTNRPFLVLVGLTFTLAIICLATAILLVLPLLFFGAQLMMAVWAAAYTQCARGAGLTGRPSRCPRCGYDITASAAVCPECGIALT